MQLVDERHQIAMRAFGKLRKRKAPRHLLIISFRQFLSTYIKLVAEILHNVLSRTPRTTASGRVNMTNELFKGLVLAVALLIGVIVGMATGILSRAGGAGTALAIRHGGIAFGGTVSLGLLILSTMGVF